MHLVVSPDGTASWRGIVLRCAVGRAGVRSGKAEGDGATPRGTFRLLEVFYRPDRLPPPETALPARALSRRDGWCDDPSGARYNAMVALPHPARCEALWREDGLYDLIAATSHNRDPVVPGAGSAIFVHVAGPGYPPTRGCVAFALGDLRRILSGWTPDDRLVVP